MPPRRPYLLLYCPLFQKPTKQLPGSRDPCFPTSFWMMARSLCKASVGKSALQSIVQPCQQQQSILPSATSLDSCILLSIIVIASSAFCTPSISSSSVIVAIGDRHVTFDSAPIKKMYTETSANNLHSNLRRLVPFPLAGLVLVLVLICCTRSNVPPLVQHRLVTACCLVNQLTNQRLILGAFPLRMQHLRRWCNTRSCSECHNVCIVDFKAIVCGSTTPPQSVT